MPRQQEFFLLSISITTTFTEDEMLFPYDDYGHTTVDFFNVLFTTEAFSEYEMKVDEDGKYKIFLKKEV